MKIETGKSGSLIAFKGKEPKIHPSAFLAEGVRIIGDVEIDEDCSVWFNSVIRGDVNYIRIGKQTNIQDLCMLHVTRKKFPLTIGKKVTVGHSATLHGATIADNCLIGASATIIDGAQVRSYSIVAAGAVVKEGFTVPNGKLVAGIPAKVVRDLTNEELQAITRHSVNYVNYSSQYRNQEL